MLLLPDFRSTDTRKKPTVIIRDDERVEFAIFGGHCRVIVGLSENKFPDRQTRKSNGRSTKCTPVHLMAPQVLRTTPSDLAAGFSGQPPLSFD
jgi:hypothetical protein